jgi:hypothetical protein
MGKMHRAQILIDPEQHQTLGEIVRIAVHHWLAERHDDQVLSRQMYALGKMDRHRQAILDCRGGKHLEVDLAEMIEQKWEERDGELFTSALRHRR